MVRQRSRKKVVKEPKKKGRHGWTTDEQAAFLTPLIPRYVENKAAKTLSDFWPPVFEKWFEQWPIRVSNTTANDSPDQNQDSDGETSDEEKETNKDGSKKKQQNPLNRQKKQIKEWFNNHTRETYKGTSQKHILDLAPPKKIKLLPLEQAYSRLFYDTRVKDIVADEWPKERARIMEQRANGEDIKAPPELAPLWYRNKMARAEFLIETDEIKAEVEAYRQSQIVNSDDEIEDNTLDPEEVKRVAMAKKRAKDQALVGDTLQRALEQIKDRTGYVGFVALAAPDGQAGGEIKTLTLFSGTTNLGHDFGHLYGPKHLKENITDPVGKFAEKVYPPNVRKSWALPRAEMPETITDSPSRATRIQPDNQTATNEGNSRSREIHDIHDDELIFPDDEQLVSKSDSAPKRPPKSKAPAIDDFANWDNGEPLTKEQRKKIMSLKSNYERSRAMNKMRNERIMRELDLKGGVAQALGGMKDGSTTRKSTPTASSKSSSPAVDASVTGSGAPSNVINSSPPASNPATPSGDGDDNPDRLVTTFGGLPPMPFRPIANNAPRILAETHPKRDGWPAWMSAAISKLEEYSNHPSWLDVLRNWLDFEDLLGYPYGQSKAVLIDKTMRPQEIDSWLKYGRKLQAMPDLTNSAEDFGKRWMKWWMALQPEWRGEGPEFATDIPEVADWTELIKGGPNGFFLILLSYGWWGAGVVDAALNEVQPAFDQWKEAFLDLDWVLKCMVAKLEESTALSLKRSHDEGNYDDGNDGAVASQSSKRTKITD